MLAAFIYIDSNRVFASEDTTAFTRLIYYK